MTRIEELCSEIGELEDQLDAIRDLIETEMNEPTWGITALYHRRTELRDAILEVLET